MFMAFAFAPVELGNPLASSECFFLAVHDLLVFNIHSLSVTWAGVVRIGDWSIMAIQQSFLAQPV